MKKTKTRSIFVNLKPVFVVSFIMTIICVSEYSVDTGYAGNVEAANQWKTIQMRVTAYCPCPKCCGNYSDGVTACGHKISPGDRFVAADKMYTFGTEIIVPGYKNSEPVKVLDRGGAIRGAKLDVFFGSHQEALEWGVRYLDVKIRY